MNQYKIIKADIHHLDELVELRIKVLLSANQLDINTEMNHVKKETYQYYNNNLKNENCIIYLVYDCENIIATGGISFYQVMPTYHNPSGKKAYIMNMYTDPNYRRKGIATKILNQLIEETKRKDCSYISLEATEEGAYLYQSYGFKKMIHEMEYIL